MQECAFLKDFRPDELVALAVGIGLALAENADDDTLSVLSSLFYSIGGTLSLIAHQRELLEGLQR